MSAPLLFNPAQALTFARMLFGEHPTEYRLIHPRRKPLSFWGVVQSENDLGGLAEHNAQGYGVYAVVNTLAPSVERRVEANKSARDADVEGVRALFVELDRDEPTPGAHLAMLQGAPLRPSLIVCSSLPHKLHAYWLVTGVEVAEFSTLQTALIAHFSGDPACKNLSRVMRVPGFWHTKAEPVLSTLVEANGARYSRDEMLAAYPELGRGLAQEAVERAEAERRRVEAKAKAGARRLNPPPQDEADRERKRALAILEGHCKTVERAGEGSRNPTLCKAAYTLGGYVAGGYLDADTVEDALLDAAKVCGLSENEAGELIPRALAKGMGEPLELDASPVGASITFLSGKRKGKPQSYRSRVYARMRGQHGRA